MQMAQGVVDEMEAFAMYTAQQMIAIEWNPNLVNKIEACISEILEDDKGGKTKRAVWHRRSTESNNDEPLKHS